MANICCYVVCKNVYIGEKMNITLLATKLSTQRLNVNKICKTDLKFNFATSFQGQSVEEDVFDGSKRNLLGSPRIISHGYKSRESDDIVEKFYKIKVGLENYRNALQEFSDGELDTSLSCYSLVSEFKKQFSLIETRKTDEVITYLTLTSKDGKINECSFDKDGKLNYIAVGIRRGEKSVRIDEFCCFGLKTSCEDFKKFNDVLVSGRQCVFRDGIVKGNGRASTNRTK